MSGKAAGSARTLFGTDGIRGRANSYPMTPDIALKLGMAAGSLFANGTGNGFANGFAENPNSHLKGHRPRVVIAKDTRLSGYMLEPALTSGFIAAGMDVVLVGPLPTPAVAMLTRSLRADLGVMLSASHNPFADNGIKLFGPDGYKLTDAQELEIERRILGEVSFPLASAEALGRAKRLDDAKGRYIEFAKHTFPKHLSLEGLKLVIDCAHGAAYQVGPTILQELGAEVIAIGNQPDGLNINDGCGSTHPESLQERVKAEKAHLGIALDGDADRLILVCEKGNLIDGDQVMAMVATFWHRQGLLKGNGIVATLMSNMGLEKYLAGLGLTLHRTPVGDRYVMEQMRKQGLNVGGEQSGHIILTDYTTTGDGLIAALQVLALLVESGKPASELRQLFTPYPQLLKNIRFQGGAPLEHPRVRAAIEAGQKQLGERGRLVIRKSGTEPLIRIMAEGENEAEIQQLAQELAVEIEQASRLAETSNAAQLAPA
jgi:phosphoglucosamine mutase